MHEHQVDDCYCPAGQAHRLSVTQNYLVGIVVLAGLAILSKVVLMVQDAVKAIRMATSHAVRMTDWELVGWSLIGFLVSLIILSILFVYFYSHQSETDTKPMAWSRRLRTWLMTRNLIKQFKLNPELRRKTVFDVLAEMEQAHEAHERVTDRDLLNDYARAYARAMASIRRTNPGLAQHLRENGVGVTGPNPVKDAPGYFDEYKLRNQ